MASEELDALLGRWEHDIIQARQIARDQEVKCEALTECSSGLRVAIKVAETAANRK